MANDAYLELTRVVEIATRKIDQTEQQNSDMLLQCSHALAGRFVSQKRCFRSISPSQTHTAIATMMTTDYASTVAAIMTACQEMKTAVQFNATGGDGRITSAVKEKDYLDTLETFMKANYPNTIFERPPDRYWYDVRINHIPINLKLTVGGTDNVFNKKSILFTLTGDESAMGNMNFSEWYKKIMAGKIKSQRDRMTEYHFLVVNKDTSDVLFKSILDIHTFKSNPCNDLQINWKNEFKHASYLTSDEDYEQKVKSLLKTLQTSVKQYLQSIIDFATANIDEDIKLA